MSGSRGRLVFAAVAAVGLLAAALAVGLSGGGSSDDEKAAACINSWNADAIARSDGAHAYQDHGYRATLVTRVDRSGNVIPEEDVKTEPTAAQRCAVVFASTNVKFEFDFGVRVFDSGRWAGLSAVDGVQPDQIVAIQADASEGTNTTLLPDGRLTD